MSIAPTQPQTAAASPRTRIRLEPEVRKQLILDAALAEFSAHGFTATRIDDIAKRAGLSKGGFYAHNPSKEEVFSALLASSVAIEDLDVEGIINQCNTAHGGLLLPYANGCFRGHSRRYKFVHERNIRFGKSALMLYNARLFHCQKHNIIK